MATRRLPMVLFVCLVGWIYAGPANGAEQVPADESGDEPVVESLFGSGDQDEDIDTEPPEAVAAEQVISDEPSPAPTSKSLFESTSANEAVDDDRSVQVGTWGEIDLHVKDLGLGKVLQLLSLQSQRNIVASRNVAGNISADLYGVDFYEALDAILHTNGFGYRETGKFIYVYSADELKALEEAERKPVTQVVRLNYLTATDARAFVEPLISTAGSIGVSGESTGGIQPSVGDAGSNTYALAPILVIRDYQEIVDEIVEVIRQVDIRPKQVLIEATILEARLTETNEFGIDLSIIADFDLDQFGGALDVVNDLIAGTVGATGQALSTNVGNTNNTAGIKIGIVNNDFAAFIKALDEVTDVTLLARPKLLVLDRQRAELLVGAKLGYLSTQATETSTTQTVEFLDIGTTLTIRPFVSDDGYIRLELRPSISDGSTVNVGGGVVIPNTTNEEMITNVIVRSGKTVVLGGLFKEDTTVTRRQVPWLGDIPIAGAAFKGHADDVTRDEVIFLVRPTIMKDEPLYAIGEHADESVEHARIGTRLSLLPWSRSKFVASHIRDAHQALEAGDQEKALWYTNMALTIDPTLVEALRLKETITGQRVYWPDRSLIDAAINKMVDDQLGATTPPSDDVAKIAPNSIAPRIVPNSLDAAVNKMVDYQLGTTTPPSNDVAEIVPNSIDEPIDEQDVSVEATPDSDDETIAVPVSDEDTFDEQLID